MFFFILKDRITLIHSSPVWDLPASRHSCLQVILYCQMAQIPFTPKISCYHYSSQEKLPYLQNYSNYYGESTILPFLKTKVNLDKVLLDDMHNKNLLVLNNGLRAFVKEKLNLVNFYILWSDETNYDQTCILSTNRLFFLIRKYYIYYELVKQRNLLKIAGLKSKAQIIRILNEVLVLLCDQLNEKKYFFGFRNPTSFDAIIGAELLLLFSNPLNNFYLNGINSKIVSLRRFVNRLKKKYIFIAGKKSYLKIFYKIKILKYKTLFKVNKMKKENYQQKKSWIFLLGSITLI